MAYTASKGGIEMFTKVAAVELGPHRIRVNCVAPGAVEVERTRLEDPDYAGTWGRITPLLRVGQPLDIARVVAFLASPEGRSSSPVRRFGSTGACTLAPHGLTSRRGRSRILDCRL